MRNKHVRNVVVGCIAVVSFVCLVLIINRPQPTSAQKPCPTDPDAVVALPEAEQRHCDEDLAALKIQADATELARIEAAPRVIPPAETFTPEGIKERGTPVPPGVIPESEMLVKEIPLLDRVDGPPGTRPDAAESVWRAGAILDSRSNFYQAMYVFTAHQACGIGIETNARSKQFPAKFYECPDTKDARLVITGVDLKTYIVSWKDQNGRTGTFDLINHTWGVS